MTSIKEQIVVKSNGVLEIRSPELRAGESVDVTVLIKTADLPEPDLSQIRDWRQFAGILKGDCGSSDNESIDADLAKEYGSTHEPKE